MLPIATVRQRLGICRMLQHLLQKALDRATRLQPQLLGDAALSQPGRFCEIRQRRHSSGGGQGQEQAIGIRQRPGCPPATSAIQADADVAVGSGGITEQDSQLFPIAEQTHPLPTGQQHPLGHSAGAEAIGPAPPVGSVQVRPETHRPGPQALTCR